MSKARFGWIAGLMLVMPGMVLAKSQILGVDQFEAVLRQCSRSAPAASAAWKIDPALATRIDAYLASQESLQSDSGPIKNPGLVDVQYLGVIINGKKQVYINAGLLDDKGRAGVACDGGRMFWGAIYDPQTGTVSDVRANGPI
ncbi:hypothetical protein [Dyella sp.]|uniref:hypothetical protein n=1 Tax=Dyella sp. TaxID=1869338 RepID=UPI002ECFCCC1